MIAAVSRIRKPLRAIVWRPPGSTRLPRPGETVSPAGPVVTFSLAAALIHAGAATPQMVAFIASWSVFDLHRVTVYEIPMLGWRFLLVRTLSVVLLSLIAALPPAPCFSRRHER